MIEGQSAVVQTLLGTLLTWGLTALGAGLVFVLPIGNHRKLLDASLGFAAGVMTAASFWSLLAPAIELAEDPEAYGALAFAPVAVGFIVGAAFVMAADSAMPLMGVSSSPVVSLALKDKSLKKDEDDFHLHHHQSFQHSSSVSSLPSGDTTRHRNLLLEGIVTSPSSLSSSSEEGNGRYNNNSGDDDLELQRHMQERQLQSWRRMLLLIVAITVHNIPEGLAVGVGFGAVGKTAASSFASARSLAIAIGIQNFPEGLAVSLPLRASGYSSMKSFWYGQLSGMVEPAAGLLGAATVSIAEPILPYALSFAAGAMIFVVVDDLIPETASGPNGRLASISMIVGFVVMMCLDVGLG